MGYSGPTKQHRIVSHILRAPEPQTLLIYLLTNWQQVPRAKIRLVSEHAGTPSSGCLSGFHLQVKKV
ncbi:hypothetical protein CYMTET_13434 [Cymbomonas tetramitiformis]|uniref:Uncharacterized protein n=1 Tax=Cymbomonas tetramitiformis TaxID=36881 RepID=A0AAE0LBG1_9CHLO|nr:hypothetical protein CYMTET_13434 [Cymbomonas tetramitiformis]